MLSPCQWYTESPHQAVKDGSIQPDPALNAAILAHLKLQHQLMQISKEEQSSLQKPWRKHLMWPSFTSCLTYLMFSTSSASVSRDIISFCHLLYPFSLIRRQLWARGCIIATISSQWTSLKALVRTQFKARGYRYLWATLLPKVPYRDDLKEVQHLVEILLALPISAALARNRMKNDSHSSLGDEPLRIFENFAGGPHSGGLSCRFSSESLGFFLRKIIMTFLQSWRFLFIWVKETIQ